MIYFKVLSDEKIDKFAAAKGELWKQATGNLLHSFCRPLLGPRPLPPPQPYPSILQPWGQLSGRRPVNQHCNIS